jgi:hypothetical protein
MGKVVAMLQGRRHGKPAAIRDGFQGPGITRQSVARS